MLLWGNGMPLPHVIKQNKMSEQEFHRYEKMPKNLKKLGFNANELAELDKMKWVVTEKVHGANFSFIYEKEQLKFAKRKSYLSWQDDFFGFQLLVNCIENQIIALFETLSTKIKAERYILYGELCGGGYPHPSVMPEEHLEAIQTGVYYAPTIQFYAFDIAIVESEDSPKYYMDYSEVLPLFQQYNLLYAQPLFIGKFHEVFDFDIKINSTLPQLLNLPPLEHNLIEGIVVKPLEHSQSHLDIRPIIKIKNPEFDEKKKFHQAEKWSYVPNINSNSEELHFLVEAAKNYVTNNRLQSAISKIGTLNYDNETRVQAIKNEFLEDTLMDFNADHDDIFEDLNAMQIDWIRERIRAAIQQLIRKNRTQ